MAGKGNYVSVASIEHGIRLGESRRTLFQDLSAVADIGRPRREAGDHVSLVVGKGLKIVAREIHLMPRRTVGVIKNKV